MILKLKVDIRPKERPRWSKKNKRMYSPVDPSETALIKLYKYYMCQSDYIMIPKGVDIFISAEIYITHSAGDIDNILKVIQDCGNKILYSDDKQIVGYDKLFLHRKSPEGKLILNIEPQDYLLEDK